MSRAAAKRLPESVEYPSSDGEPMAETDQHRDEMVALIEALKGRYADREDVYVAGNLLVYYEEGDPKARFAPDVFVVFGPRKRQRSVYRLWEEKPPPSVVIEVTSRGTWLEDNGNKKALCARLGVSEYYLFDPDAEYLAPPLQGFLLKAGAHVPIRPGADGGLRSPALGLKLVREAGRLRLVDLATRKRLLRPEELEAARRDAEAGRRDAEAGRRDAEARAQSEAAARSEAEARAKAAEAELARLRGRAGGRKSRA